MRVHIGGSCGGEKKKTIQNPFKIAALEAVAMMSWLSSSQIAVTREQKNCRKTRHRLTQFGFSHSLDIS